MRKTTILDDPKQVRKIDKSNMLDHCIRFPQYSEDAIKRAKQAKILRKVKISKRSFIKYGKPRNILIAGMGGSAIGGEMLQAWLRDVLPIPIDICREHNLPAYAGAETLAFVISYSGETEETLKAFLEAIRRRCMTLTITSGGHLLSFSKKLNIPYVSIPEGLPPRASFPYIFFPCAIVLNKTTFIPKIEGEIGEALGVLRRVAEENAPIIPTKNNLSKKLALELEGTIPVIYGFGPYEAVAHRMKTQFNENSKLLSRYDVFPELNHNEVVGWGASRTLTKNFSIILIRDREEPPEIRHRIELTKALVSDRAKKVYEIYAVGRGRLAKMLSVLLVGDLLSVYLAVLRGVDPFPVKPIEDVKRSIRERFDLDRTLKAEIENILS
ncbi:MAG: bifunctional phosphoglucose/phosphomannose isomerase [Candidatus Bathyarchaeia archaeon]